MNVPRLIIATALLAVSVSGCGRTVTLIEPPELEPTDGIMPIRTAATVNLTPTEIAGKADTLVEPTGAGWRTTFRQNGLLVVLLSDNPDFRKVTNNGMTSYVLEDDTQRCTARVTHYNASVTAIDRPTGQYSLRTKELRFARRADGTLVDLPNVVASGGATPANYMSAQCAGLVSQLPDSVFTTPLRQTVK